MIKKYITLAALLSAGTALANAAGEYTIETTFLRGSSSGNIAFTATSKLTDHTLDQTYSSNKSVFPQRGTDGSNIGQNEIMGGEFATGSPYIPVKLDSWHIDLDYSGFAFDYRIQLKPNEKIRIDRIEVKLGAFQINNRGGWITGSGQHKINVAIGIPSTSAKQTFRDEIITGVGNRDVSGTTGVEGVGTGPMEEPLNLQIDHADANNSAAFTFATADTVPKNLTLTFDPASSGGTNPDYGVALKSVKVYLSVVPEPSAFGLLAGLGALALVGARRRRK